MYTSVTFELKGDFRKPGFKPLLWQLVSRAGLSGWAADAENAVRLRLEGEEEAIKAFIRPIPGALYPPYMLKEIRVLDKQDIPDPPDRRRPFKILSSAGEIPVVPPDFAPCPDCLKEIMDPASRRYCYPFWSCAKCGGGYSALLRNPFVRRNTSLASFPPCRKCRAEAADRNDRHHFGSEFLACPDCGPHLFLLNAEGEPSGDTDCICSARRELTHGKVLALQSMFGGFQLFVNGTDPDAVRILRKRKKLPSRPIAVMARDIEAVRRICFCSHEEEELLLSPAAPTVILAVRPDIEDLLPAGLLSPDGPRLGVSLPSTLLMHLIFKHIPSNESAPAFDYLATISSNWSGRSSMNGIDELIHALHGVADLYLCHDLRIGMDCPASVAVVRDGAPQIWRRSRGYAPAPIRLRKMLRRNAVAFGSDINSSVALAAGDRIISSQHLGDILNADATARLSAILEHFTILFDNVPDVAVCDMNPHLRSSEEAIRFSEKYAIPLINVQTHHAQALACMAEHNLEHALAVVFDNGEPGPDGVYWGAELLDARVDSFARLGTFQSVSLPGRENALTRPVRQLIGRMLQSGVDLTPALLEHLTISEEEAALWRRNCSGEGRFLLTHAAARLFDAVSAGLGLAPDFIGYRGQSAARLEYAAMRATGGLQGIPGWMYDKFEFDTREDDSPKLVVDWTPLFRNFAEPGWITPENVPSLALAFHAKIADAVAYMAHYGAARARINDIVLSGSLFMNGILLDLVLGKLRAEKFNVFFHRSVPMDESGICVGQAYHASC